MLCNMKLVLHYMFLDAHDKDTAAHLREVVVVAVSYHQPNMVPQPPLEHDDPLCNVLEPLREQVWNIFKNGDGRGFGLDVSHGLGHQFADLSLPSFSSALAAGREVLAWWGPCVQVNGRLLARLAGHDIVEKLLWFVDMGNNFAARRVGVAGKFQRMQDTHPPKRYARRLCSRKIAADFQHFCLSGRTSPTDSGASPMPESIHR